jgi:zinc protease
LAVPVLHGAEGLLPWEVQKQTLDNGLDVLVVEMPEFKDVVNINVLILAGSRNEIEAGRSGLAHLFEHIAFRHRYEDPSQSYDNRIEQLGAFDNAWTWFDVTYYHPVSFASNLEELIALQAERFVSMDFSERIYRTEAGAVLGEYRRIASDPSLRMDEVLIDLAYGPEHGYGHTTMGYLADVQDMPNSYTSGKAFYETYYRPNNAVLLVTGDVQAEEVFRLAKMHFGPWQRGEIPELPDVQPFQGPKQGYVPWQADVPPRLIWAYLVPAFDPESREGAVLQLLPELIAGETSPLYQKLRYELQLATEMAVQRRSAEGFDGRLLETALRLDKEKFDRQGGVLFEQAQELLQAGFQDLHSFSQRPGAAETLAALKSRYRYDLLAALNSPHNVAETLAGYYRFQRDPNVLQTLVDSVQRIEPADVDAYASRYLVPERNVAVTMSHQADRQQDEEKAP